MLALRRICNDVSSRDFAKCVKRIFNVLEKKNISKSNDDPFTKRILAAAGGMTTEQWDAAERQRRYEKALSMVIGDFHEELMGKFRGYKTLPLGHSSGLDVESVNGDEIFEVKNRDNTMNSGSAETVIRKLVKASDSGKKAILVLVNSVKKTLPRFKAPKEIQVWDGKKAYAHLSGRDDFYNDLLDTLDDVFTNYKTYAEFEKGIEQSEIQSP